MASNDRFLIGILAGVAILVVAAFVVTLSRPAPDYRTDDAPEATVHNYLLALQRREYDRAWRELSPSLKGYPASAEVFAADIGSFVPMTEFGNIELDVQPADVTGDVAVVVVRRTDFYNRGLFDTGQSTHTFRMRVEREDGAWRLKHGEEFWWYCWDEPSDRCDWRLPGDADRPEDAAESPADAGP